MEGGRVRVVVDGGRVSVVVDGGRVRVVVDGGRVKVVVCGGRVRVIVRSALTILYSPILVILMCPGAGAIEWRCWFLPEA